MPRERSRHLRVGAELQRVLNTLLQSEVKDPRLDGVRVNEVEVSGDLGVAKVYFGTLDPDQDTGPVEDALRKAAGFLRGRVGHEMRLRRVPELRFHHDLSTRHGFELSRLLSDISEDPSDASSD
jgi:ribosome-binding factor A